MIRLKTVDGRRILAREQQILFAVERTDVNGKPFCTVDFDSDFPPTMDIDVDLNTLARLIRGSEK